MPLQKLSQEEIEYLVKLGYKKEDLQDREFDVTPPEQQQKEEMGMVRSAIAPLKAHAGGLTGGAAAGLGTAAAIASWAGGPITGIPATLGLIGASTLAGLGGSYVGQKIQDSVESEETKQALEEEYRKAVASHPYIAKGSEIAASALLSGGKPSLSTIPKALKGEKEAIANLAFNSAINPAINSGISLATTGQLPTNADIIQDAIGGAVFSGQQKWASKLMGHNEPLPEANKSTPKVEPVGVSEYDEIVTPHDKDIVEPPIKEEEPQAEVKEKSAEGDNIPEEVGMSQEELDALTQDKNFAPPKEDEVPRASYIGKQEGFGNVKGFKLYNLNHDLKDNEGKILHAKGSTVTEHTLNKYGLKGDDIVDAPPRELSPERDFTKNLLDPRLFEKLNLKEDTKVKSETLVNWMRNKFGENSKTWKLLQEYGIPEALRAGGEMTIPEVQSLINNKGPQINVHSYGAEGKVSEAAKELGRMQHEWYDAAPYNVRISIDRAMAEARVEGMDNNAVYTSWRNQAVDDSNGKIKAADVDKYVRLHLKQRAEPPDTTPKMTGQQVGAYKSVSPKSTEEPMPEWMMSKSAKNVQRVDVVIPLNKWDKTKTSEFPSPEEIRKQRGNLWQPDNLHEQHPNTLGWAAIQYETGPEITVWEGRKVRVVSEIPDYPKYVNVIMEDGSQIAKEQAEDIANGISPEKAAVIVEKAGLKKVGGEKIAHIFEVQSRWGQVMRERRQELKDTPASETVSRRLQESRLTQDHPLLRDYNRLILKAAIEQARKEGATHIAISDAETAMMSEGHDTLQRRGARINPANWSPTGSDTGGWAEREPRVGDWAVERENGWLTTYPSKDMAQLALETGKMGHTVRQVTEADYVPKIDQEPGMRLNYDKILPTIASELTGSKGEKISLGEHKNAYVPSEYPDGQRLRQANAGQPRQNLIFRNPDGTPKTDVSAMLYPIDKLSPKTESILGKPPESGSKYTLPPAISQHIQSGKANVQNTLELMVKHAPDNEFTPLAKYYLENGDKYGLRATIAHDPQLGVLNNDRSNYTLSDHQINLAGGDLHDPHVLLHEIGHAFTHYKLPEQFRTLNGQKLKVALDNYLADKGGNAGIKELIHSYYQAAKELGIHDELFGGAGSKSKNGLAGFPEKAVEKGLPHGYAMGNLSEFVTMINSNKKFQQHLNEMPSGLGDNKSLWSRIVDAVRSILGVDVKERSLLERALKASDELVRTEGERPKFNPNEDTFAPPAAKDKDESRKGFMRGLEATFDKVDRVATFLGDAARNWHVSKREYVGLANGALSDLSKYDRTTVNKVMALHDEAFRKGIDTISLKGKEKEISDIFRQYYGKIADERRKLGIKISGREAGKNDLYIPHQLSDKALDLFTKHATTPEAIHAENMWVKHVMKESGGRLKEEKVRQDVQDYIAALKGDKNNYRTIAFGAIRRAEGFGLPEGLRELDGIKSLSKYGNRAANDLAFYRHFEGDSRVAASLKLKDPNTGVIPTHPLADSRLAAAKEVDDMMKWITNSFNQQDSPRINSLVRVVNNALLGTATGLRDTASILQNMAPYINKFSDLKAFATGITKLREESRNALLSGAKQPNIDKMQFNMVMDSPDRFSAILNKVATGMRKWQGREFLENINRDITFAVGKELALSNIEGAKSGHKPSIEFLEKFGTGVGDVMTLAGKDKEEALNRMAANFVERNQGTYGGVGLPLGIVDSKFAPFFALQKWSVEKSNVIYKDVFKPAFEQKNFLPMLNYTLGALVTGVAIQQLNELMTGRKGQDPTVKEAMVHPDPLTVVSELATIMQLASCAGIVGDAVKTVSDVGIRGKSPRNVVSFPAATAALDLEEQTKFALEAVRQGENPWDVVKQYALDMMTHNVQLARMVANRTINKDKIEDSDKFRDVRTFNEMEGKPASEFAKTNTYLGMDERKLKKEEDLGEAMKQLPQIVEKIIKKYGNDPEMMKQKLAALKQNTYQTFPSIESRPISFFRYLDFLQKRDGPEKANELLMDYMKRNAINKAKASALP